MCFSATASFTASAVVGATGIVAIRATRHRGQLLLAAIPLIFASHQFLEGIHWLALSGRLPPSWATPAAYGFLAIGDVLWPFWIPLAVLLIERERGDHDLLRLVVLLGCAVTLSRAVGLAFWPVSAWLIDSHIHYELSQPPWLRLPSDVGYAVCAVMPFLLGRIPAVRWLGLCSLASLVMAKLYYYETFISVWCFFAALGSTLIVVVLQRINVPAVVAVRATRSSGG